METVAEERITLVHPDGTRTTGAIRIGRPYVVNDGEARCPVAIDGLHGPLADIAGSTTFQALLLATRLCADLLRNFVEKGGRILDAKGDEPFALDAYFDSRAT